jgi:hypothetical protein
VPLPAGITPKTVTVGIPTFTVGGRPATGSATLIVATNLVHVPTGTPLFSGRLTKQFKGLTQVEFTDLVPTDDPGLNRFDWTYRLEVRINGAEDQPDPINFELPAAGPDVVDSDLLVEVPSSAGTPVFALAVRSIAGLDGDVTATQLATALNASGNRLSDVALRAAFGLEGTAAEDIADTGTDLGAAAAASFVPRWQASHAYSSGDLVLNPSGQIVRANSSFTSGGSYDSTKWTIVSGGVFRVQAPASGDSLALVNAAIALANVAGGVVELSAGTFSLSAAPTTLAAGVTVRGDGTGTIVRLDAAYASSTVFTLGANCTVKNLRIIGGTSTTVSSSNPSITSAIQITAGNATVSDLDFTAVNGWCIESNSTSISVAGMTITNIRGFYNRGGIHIKSYTTVGFIAQAIISNINLQIIQGADVLFFEDSNDIQVSGINACFDGAVAGIYGIHVKGSSSSMFFHNVDVGVFPNAPGVSPIVFIESDGAGHAPANIQFEGGILQTGRNGARIDDGTNLTFRGIQFSRNASAGVYIAGTPAKQIVIDDCHFVVNGATAPRIVTDGVTTSGSAVVTSATAAFTSADVGMLITGTGLSSAAYIASVQSATQVTLSANATATATGVTLTVSPNAEILINTQNSVEVSQNRFTTPYGTGASQTAYVLRTASPFNATVFRNNILIGAHPTANLYLGVAPKFIQDNVGYNPLGWQTVAVPASGGAAGGTSVPRTLYVTANAAGPCTCTITLGLNGAATQNIVIPAGQCVPIFQYPGTNVTFTYTNAPTMAVFAS